MTTGLVGATGFQDRQAAGSGIGDRSFSMVCHRMWMNISMSAASTVARPSGRDSIVRARAQKEGETIAFWLFDHRRGPQLVNESC